MRDVRDGQILIVVSTSPDDASQVEANTKPEASPAPTDSPVAVPGGATAPDATPPASVRHTRVSGTWVALIVAVIVLIFLLIFILQNLLSVTLSFLGASGHLPLGVAMLLAAVGGALLVALVGTARILQLRRHAGKQRRQLAANAQANPVSQS